MRVYVVGVALHPASTEIRELPLEEMAGRTARAALDSAGVTGQRFDGLTIDACDPLAGGSISSMSSPARGDGTDEIRVADSGASAMCVAYARLLAGESELGIVLSWCKSSQTDVEAVTRLRGDPWYIRPLGIGAAAGDALFAQAVGLAFGIDEAEVAHRVSRAYERAAANPRGVRHRAPTAESVRDSAYDALPLRSGHRAPLTDGAVALVLASQAYLDANRQCRPLARLAGVGSGTDSYGLDRERLGAMRSARHAWQTALRQAELRGAADFGAIELDTQTGWHEAAYVRAFGIDVEEAVSPSGGPFAQNPLFCSGLVNAAEAVLQVAGRAGPVQRPRVRRAVAHGCHGIAQQGNVVMVFEAPEE